MRRRSTQPRGQATVELALGLLVFITIVVFGIHFAEVSYMSLRVQHAAAYALFDLTGQRVHEEGYKMNRTGTIAGLTTSQAREYFNDFQANDGDARAVGNLSHVFTEIDSMFVQCTNEASISWQSTLDLNPFDPFDGSKGGVKCTASGRINLAPGFPKSFNDGQWNLGDEHYVQAPTQYTVCATPRARNGSCGQFGLLVGDHSLQGEAESRSHDLFNGGNDTYFDLVDKAFPQEICPMSTLMATTITLYTRPDACMFQMSYKGVEHQYKQDIGSVHGGGETTWVTGGTIGTRSAETDHPNARYLLVDRF